MLLKYTISTQTYGAPGNITLDRLCNGFSINNTGNSVCVFNDDPLQPGDSKTIGGNYLEVVEGRFSILFQPIDSPPPGYVQDDECIVTQKYYLPNQPIIQQIFQQMKKR